MAGHGAPVPASRTPHTSQSRWRHPPEEDKKESLLRGWGSFFPRRGNDAAGSAREATVSPAEGEARRGCPAAPGWRLPPRPELARRRPGRALGSAPPPPSLRPSLLLLRRRRRRGGRGRGGGSYCGERRAASGPGRRRTPAVNAGGRGGSSRPRGPAGPTRLGVLGTRAGALRAPGCRRAGRLGFHHCNAAAARRTGPAPSGRGEQSRPVYPEPLGRRGGPCRGWPRRARGRGEATAGGGPRAQATPRTSEPGGGSGSDSIAER